MDDAITREIVAVTYRAAIKAIRDQAETDTMKQLSGPEALRKCADTLEYALNTVVQ
jgi:hypothetical protein